MRAVVQQIGDAEARDLIYHKFDHIVDEGKSSLVTAASASCLIFTGSVDGKLLCMHGLIPQTLLSDSAYLWLHITPEMKEHSFLFIRHSQRWVEQALKSYPIIKGHATVGAERSLAWLRLLGAEFSQPQGNLLPFTIRAKHG